MIAARSAHALRFARRRKNKQKLVARNGDVVSPPARMA
jgi:hypothetical protein